MFEQSEKWNAYYRELEPGKRRAMLNELCASEPDDGANAYRKALFEARHVDEKSPGREVDRMLFMCVYFLQLYKTARIFKSSAVKEILQSLRETRFDMSAQYGEAGEKALYWEIRNAAARYLSTCASPGYNRGLFGLTPSRDTGRQERILRDVWQMSEGLSRRTGLTGELALWNQAILDTYSLTGEDARTRFENTGRMRPKG